MSVYKHKNGHFHYDFVVKGQRFHGSTGCETRRAAEACERRLRNERGAFGAAHIQQRLDTAAPSMTLDTACERWWIDKGERLDSADDRQRQIALWLQLLGKDRRMDSIREADIFTAIRKRRAIPYRRKLPSDATVNRFIAALRAVWRHLDTDEHPLPRIRWGKMITPETEEKPPEISSRQLDALDEAAGAGDAEWLPLMCEVAYTYGLRAGELYFGLDQFDPAEQSIRIPKKRRKKEVTLTVALLPEHAGALAARWSRAKAAGLPHLWYDQGGERKLIPVSRSRGDYQLRKALKAAGLGTKIHNLRHHAGTQLLRATGNLKLVKEALGHAVIQSTVRYAHVSEADLRAGFARVSRHSPDARAASKKNSKK